MNSLNNVGSLLETNDTTLNQITASLFIRLAKLDQPILGNYSFSDVFNDFLYSLREYSINNNIVDPCTKDNFRVLLRKNAIPFKAFRDLTMKVNKLLLSYTDGPLSKEKKRIILEKQIREHLGSIPDKDDDKEMYKIGLVMNADDEFQKSKKTYLDSIIRALKKAELNQIANNEYLAIIKLFTTYKIANEMVQNYNYRDIKDYLKKTKDIKKLIGYTLNLYIDENEFNPLYELILRAKLNNLISMNDDTIYYDDNLTMLISILENYCMISQEKNLSQDTKFISDYLNEFYNFTLYDINETLSEYCTTSDEKLEEKVPDQVSTFLIYLLYGKHISSALLIHSLLGYRYKGAMLVYQKLFLKDKKAGNSEKSFLYDIDITNYTEQNLTDENSILYEQILRKLSI